MRNAYKILVEVTERRRAGGGDTTDVNGKKHIFLTTTLLRKSMSTRFIWRGIFSNVNEVMNSGLCSRRKHFLIN